MGAHLQAASALPAGLSYAGHGWAEPPRAEDFPDILAFTEALVDFDREVEEIRPPAIILALDGDAAGQVATLRALRRLADIPEPREPVTPTEIRERIFEIERLLRIHPPWPDAMLSYWRAERTALVQRLYPAPTRYDDRDLVEIISRYTTLKQRGRQLWGLCPKHPERTPSFSVDAQKGAWYCWHEGVGGGVAAFLRWIGAAA